MLLYNLCSKPFVLPPPSKKKPQPTNQTQQGVATVPKSANPDRLRANIDIFDFRLSDADVDAITAFDIGPDGR